MNTFIDQQDKFMEENKKGNTKNALQMLQKHPKIAVSNISNFLLEYNCNKKNAFKFHFL